MIDLDIFSLTWIFAVSAVFIAAFIRGLSGFGFALVLAPILLLILEPTSVVIINLSLGLVSNIIVLATSFKQVNFKKILPMIIGGAAGIPLGTFIITHIPASSLKILIGGITVVTAVIMTLGFSKTFKRENIAGGIAGLLGGTLASSTSLGGPPVVLFVHNQKWDNQSIHAGLAAFFFFAGSFSLVALWASELMDFQIIISAATLLPSLLAGTFIGMMVFKRINSRHFRWISLVIIIFSGISGILSGLGVFS